MHMSTGTILWCINIVIGMMGAVTITRMTDLGPR
jgi:hypothetical protein